MMPFPLEEGTQWPRTLFPDASGKGLSSCELSLLPLRRSAIQVHSVRQAALYASMCGHVGRILPVCRGWEDTTWAFLRSWLDAAVDDRLREHMPTFRSAAQVANRRPCAALRTCGCCWTR